MHAQRRSVSTRLIILMPFHLSVKYACTKTYKSRGSVIKGDNMKNKGFTMVELLVTLGISSIVVGLIFAFFMSSYKGYKSVRNNSEMQFHAQYILSFMGEKIMNSNSINYMMKKNTEPYNLETIRNTETEYPLISISFKYGNMKDENYVFRINNSIISYGKGEKEMTSTVELGNFVKGMYISVLKDECFQNAKAVKLKIVMEKDGQTYEAFQAIYMRNN